jgi:hypothetical protein
MSADAPNQPNLRAEAIKAARAKSEFILSRAYGLMRNPTQEWKQIDAEETSIFQVLLGYTLPLAALFALATFLGSFLLGERMGDTVVRPEVGPALVSAVVWTVMLTAGIGVLGLLASMIAENFEAERQDVRGVKLVAYAFTPTLVAGLVNIVPAWGVAAVAVGLGATAYVLFRGIPIIMRAPESEAQNYTATVMVLGLVLILLLGLLSFCTSG